MASYTALRTLFIDPRGACDSGAFQGLNAVPSQNALRAGVSVTCRINVIRPTGRNGDSSSGHSTVKSSIGIEPFRSCTMRSKQASLLASPRESSRLRKSGPRSSFEGRGFSRQGRAVYLIASLGPKANGVIEKYEMLS